MSNVNYTYYDSEYEKAFLRLKATAFQDFFADIMEKRYPKDFMRVRPWGSSGDLKNDGYLKSRRTLFQVYAPNELRERDALAKIDTDFQGALRHWQQYFDKWVFVHNSRDGIGPGIARKLLDLNASHNQITIESWGFEEIRREFHGLDDHAKASLVGRGSFNKRGQTITGRSGHRYIVGSTVGYGAVGVVCAGKETTGSKCAIKFLRQSSEVSDARTKERFLLEATLLCERLHSPNIVTGIDYGEHDGDPFLVMEWVGNGNLTERIADNTHDNQLLTKWICQLLTCFRELRNKGILHRDIQPNNILLNDDNHIKLGDLGEAKVLNRTESITLDDDTMGIIPYSSPLQRKRPAEATGKDDLYSICAVMFGLITGELVPPMIATPLHARSSSRVPLEFARLVDKVLAYGRDLEDVFDDMCRIYDIDQEALRTLHAEASAYKTSAAPSVRILHLVYDRSYGGIETYIKAITKYSRHFHSVKSIFEFGRGGYPSNEMAFEQAAAQAIAELKLANRSYNHLSRVLGRVSIFLKGGTFHAPDRILANDLTDEITLAVEKVGGFDIIHSHFIQPALLASQQKLKVVCTSHSLMSQELRLEDRFLPPGREAEVLSWAKKESTHYRGVKNVFALCAAHAEEIRSVSGKHVDVMKPILDYTEFLHDDVRDIDSHTARELLSLPDRATVLFIGRPSYRKGLQILIDALSDLEREVQMLIVGRGFVVDSRKATLTFGNQVIKLKPNVAEKILRPVSPSTRQQITLLYKCCDLMVCPSIYEPFGYVNLECMAAKRAVVASDTGGISEIIQDQVTGLLFQTGDFKALRSAIRRLLDDPTLRARLADKGFEKTTTAYRPEGCIEQLDFYYDRVAAGN